VLALLCAGSATGCGTQNIPNTHVEDTEGNREVLDFVELYRDAVQNRDSAALLGWFAIWTPLAIGVQLLIAHEARWMASAARQLARPALTGALAALALATWFSEPFAALSFWTPPAAMQTNWLAIWPLLAVALALFAAISAYRLRDPVLIGIAIAGALLHLEQFYYLLGVTLVVKSWIMFVAGVVLSLAARSLARLPAAAAGGQP
jgi:hypothetical protein